MDFNPNKKNVIKNKESQRIEKLKILEVKKIDLEAKIREQKAKYADLDREFERIDDSGVSTIKLGEEMEDVQKLTEELEKELIVIKKKIETETNINQ